MMNTNQEMPDNSYDERDAPAHSGTEPASNSRSTEDAATTATSAKAGRKRGPRREFRWSKAARDLVRAHLQASGPELTKLISRLVQESGYPRWACSRFARQMGVLSKRVQRRWTEAEQQRLEKLIDLHSVNEIAKILRRSQSSVWHMLYRMGCSAAMGKDGFTKNTLAVALHVAPMQIEAWINRGWLQAREVKTGRLKRILISSEDFCRFCKEHTRDVVGNRLSKERLEFVYHFAFPPSHAELLPVRASKKERNAYAAQMKKEEESEDTYERFGPASEDDEDDACDRIA